MNLSKVSEKMYSIRVALLIPGSYSINNQSWDVDFLFLNRDFELEALDQIDAQLAKFNDPNLCEEFRILFYDYQYFVYCTARTALEYVNSMKEILRKLKNVLEIQ